MARNKTIRVKGEIKIKFQMTGPRAEQFTRMFDMMARALADAPYPYEWINPEKGDYITPKVGYEVI